MPLMCPARQTRRLGRTAVSPDIETRERCLDYRGGLGRVGREAELLSPAGLGGRRSRRPPRCHSSVRKSRALGAAAGAQSGVGGAAPTSRAKTPSTPSPRASGSLPCSLALMGSGHTSRQLSPFSVHGRQGTKVLCVHFTVRGEQHGPACEGPTSLSGSA